MKRISFLAVFISLMITGIAGADSSDWDARLIEAAAQGNLAEVESALTIGADINSKGINDTGATALMWASNNGHVEVVKLLIENGAELDIKAINGTTALMLASQNAHTEIVKLLCEWGSDVNIKAIIDNIEYTALTAAKKMGSKDIVGILESIGTKE